MFTGSLYSSIPMRKYFVSNRGSSPNELWPIAFMVFRELRYFRTKLCFMSEKLKTNGDEVTQKGDLFFYFFVRLVPEFAICGPNSSGIGFQCFLMESVSDINTLIEDMKNASC